MPNEMPPPAEFPPEATGERPKVVHLKQPQPVTTTDVPALDWADLASKAPPERRWAVKGWLGFGHVTLLVGLGGIGKTLLAQQMASCLALGRTFVSDIDHSFRCLMWACEDDHDELWRRQINIARWCKVGLEAFSENLIIVPRHGHDNALVSTEYGKLLFSPLLAELAEQSADLSADVVILDNVGQLYGGGENDRHAVTAFLNALSGALPGKALLLLAHPSRSSGSEFSGSSAWENVARTRLYLGASLPGEKQEEDPSDAVRYLARRKANYSQKDWRRLTYADGALTPEEQEGQGIVGTIRAEKAERTVLSAMAKLAELGIAPTDGATSPRYLPRVMKDYKLTEGLNREEIADAMRRLIMEGKLERGMVGKTENRNPIQGIKLKDNQ